MALFLTVIFVILNSLVLVQSHFFFKCMEHVVILRLGRTHAMNQNKLQIDSHRILAFVVSTNTFRLIGLA